MAGSYIVQLPRFGNLLFYSAALFLHIQHMSEIAFSMLNLNLLTFLQYLSSYINILEKKHCVRAAKLDVSTSLRWAPSSNFCMLGLEYTEQFVSYLDGMMYCREMM